MTVTLAEPPAPPVPAPLPVAPSKVKTWLKKAWASIKTVATSSAAVKEEKSLAILVVTGVLLSLGASSALVQLVSSIINGL